MCAQGSGSRHHPPVTENENVRCWVHYRHMSKSVNNCEIENGTVWDTVGHEITL